MKSGVLRIYARDFVAGLVVEKHMPYIREEREHTWRWRLEERGETVTLPNELPWELLDHETRQTAAQTRPANATTGEVSQAPAHSSGPQLG